ncbi:MAG: hypothetical protein ACLPMG_09450 [Terriglobales bacterium]
MRRFLFIATLSLFLCALPLWAQRRGGGGGSAHFASRGSFAGHSTSSSGSFHSGNPGRGPVIHQPIGRPPIGHPYYHHRVSYGRRHYPYATYDPYGYYGWYADPFYDTGDQDAYAEEYRSVPYRNDDRDNEGLQRDVQALSGKIDRLQEDVEARNRPKAEEEPATALVFRDKHVEEVRNYAIAGGTLWVLNDHQTGKKIPLAQLDLVATAKMNDERGVEFQVPK